MTPLSDTKTTSFNSTPVVFCIDFFTQKSTQHKSTGYKKWTSRKPIC